MWALLYSRRAQQDLRRLDPPIRRRVTAALESAATDGEHPGLKRLSGRHESRLRVGDWRVIVRLDPAADALLVLRVLPRGRAYDR